MKYKPPMSSPRLFLSLRSRIRQVLDCSPMTLFVIKLSQGNATYEFVVFDDILLTLKFKFVESILIVHLHLAHIRSATDKYTLNRSIR